MDNNFEWEHTMSEMLADDKVDWEVAVALAVSISNAAISATDLGVELEVAAEIFRKRFMR
jgi:hypothetical protein